MIRLFTTSFPEPDPVRRAEYSAALARNLACGAIKEVCILDEGSADLPRHARLSVRPISKRPTFNDYFSWINELAVPGDVSIVANADICFDERIAILRSAANTSVTALALARWDEDGITGNYSVCNRNDSQDAWVFRGPVDGVNGDFLIGVPRCDNRLVSELQIAGFNVRNPSFSIRSFHLHRSRQNEYPGGSHPGFVPPPYGYVWPHNLWSLPRTLLHNFRNRDARAGWRLDRRFWGARLKLHWLEKGFAAVTGKSGSRVP